MSTATPLAPPNRASDYNEHYTENTIKNFVREFVIVGKHIRPLVLVRFCFIHNLYQHKGWQADVALEKALDHIHNDAVKSIVQHQLPPELILQILTYTAQCYRACIWSWDGEPQVRKIAGLILGKSKSAKILYDSMEVALWRVMRIGIVHKRRSSFAVLRVPSYGHLLIHIRHLSIHFADVHVVKGGLADMDWPLLQRSFPVLKTVVVHLDTHHHSWEEELIDSSDDDTDDDGDSPSPLKQIIKRLVSSKLTYLPRATLAIAYSRDWYPERRTGLWVSDWEGDVNKEVARLVVSIRRLGRL